MAYRGERGLGMKSRILLEHARRIIEECKPITVRGVCYKLFVEGLIPSMHKNETNKVSDLLTRGRKLGIIPWDSIVDESRQMEHVASWDNLEQFAGVIERSYRKDFWTEQDYCVQVWSEKSTIGGVIRPVTDALGVSFMAVHGYGSTTVVHNLAEASTEDDRQWVVLYVGDHDPSGMHMSEVDLPERTEEDGGDVEIIRVALLSPDVRGLPSFPAKVADSRHTWYQERYGNQAWEIDAMDPNALRNRVEAAIREYINEEAWDRMKLVEAAEQRTVAKVAAAMRG